jgi:hypothetical protein
VPVQDSSEFENRSRDCRHRYAMTHSRLVSFETVAMNLNAKVVAGPAQPLFRCRVARWP